MKKATRMLAVLLSGAMIIGMIAGCGNSGAPASSAASEAESAAETTTAKKKVALVLPGKKDDVSFNQAMYRGMTEFAEAHSDSIELSVVEDVYDVADIEPALIDYADEGYDVIIGHGYQFTEPVVKVAKEFKDKAFLLGCGVDQTTNSAIYDVQLEAGGYLMGVIAGLASQSGKVGVIGGGEGSEITRGHEGFKAGAQSVGIAAGDIQEVYTGDWNDTTGAYEAAVGMYDSGVDVIWHSGDGIGLGVVQAAQEKDMYVLGNVEDQLELAPKNVLSGLQYEWANALERIFASIDDGSFFKDGKEVYMINVENGGLSMTSINDPKGWLDDDAKAQIDEVYEKLGKNEIDLPEV